MKGCRQHRRILAWALYDCANSAFAVAVMAGFFPIFFKEYWAAGMSVTESSFYLGAANSVASLIIVLLAPLLGALADQSRGKKGFLLAFTLLGIAATAALHWVEAGAWEMAAGLYVVATIGFSGGIVFYDALLVDVAPPHRLDRVSALGYGFGYLGGGILFAVAVLMTLQPAWFTLPDTATAVQWSFLLVALWWALFSLPLVSWIPPPARSCPSPSPWALFRGAVTQLWETFAEIRQLRTILLFLLSYWLYIDAVDTIIKMAVDYGMALGFDSSELIVALLITQFVGFPAAIAFGLFGERFGAKRGIYIAIVIYFGVVIWASRMEKAWEFYAMAVTIGLVQGGIQALSRSFYARLIPADKAGEFFGFYNMLGRFAAITGPILMGAVGLLTENPRLSVLTIAFLLLAGLVLLFFVDEGDVNGGSGAR